MNAYISGPQTLRETLLAAGFMAAKDGRLRRGPLAANFDGDWLTFEPMDVDTFHLPQLSLGSAGLWKSTSPGAYVFETPVSALQAADAGVDEDEAGENPTEQLAAWCEATLEGETPANWQPPEENEARSWLSPDLMVIRRGPLVRKIELVCEPCRLAVRAVLVSEVSGSLSAARQAWIERKLLFAQRQWRMVRLGFDGGRLAGFERKAGSARRPPAIAVEADLTGCPAALCRELLLASVSALRQVGARSC